VSSTSINIALNKISNKVSHSRASNPISSSLCDHLSPVYFQPDLHQVCSFSSVNRFTTSHTGAHGEQVKLTTTPTHETQFLPIPPLGPPTTTSHPNIPSSTPSGLHLNTTQSHNRASQIKSGTSHYGPAHLNSTFMDTSSTWDIPGQTSDISSETSIQENILGLSQKKDRVQVQNWLYETSNTKITLAERLEKMKWETKRYEKL
jgi:hypothetical protein